MYFIYAYSNSVCIVHHVQVHLLVNLIELFVFSKFSEFMTFIWSSTHCLSADTRVPDSRKHAGVKVKLFITSDQHGMVFFHSLCELCISHMTCLHFQGDVIKCLTIKHEHAVGSFLLTPQVFPASILSLWKSCENTQWRTQLFHDWNKLNIKIQWWWIITDIVHILKDSKHL